MSSQSTPASRQAAADSGATEPEGQLPPPLPQVEMPAAVSLDTKVPIADLMGAVEAIHEHHQWEVEQHRLEQQQQAGSTSDSSAGSSSGSGATDGATDPAASVQAAAGGDGGKLEGDGQGSGSPPLGYPGTFFLEEPLRGAAANTLIRMWQPPPGGHPPYPPYPGPPQYPAYPTQPYPGQHPGAPPAQPSGGGSTYPTVHHTSAPAAGASAAPAYPNPYASAQPSHQQQQQQQQQRPHDPRYSAQVPAPMPPAGGGKKKAFICGINYFGTSAQLKGCINDAKCMEYLLKNKFGFRPENILMMTDDCPDPLRRPTRTNMFQGFRWLMMDMRPGDSLIFHFSGHGSQQRDYSGEEVDGMNETLCPVDHRHAGEIVDDDLNRAIVNPLPAGVKLHCIIDACHSGSVMDLPYQAHVRGGYAQWEASYRFTRSHKGTAGGFAVQFGASKDSQTAADTQALAGNASTGAATFCFIQAIERRGTKLSYGELLLAMHHTLQATMGPAAAGPPGGMAGGLLGMLLGGSMMMGGYRGQEPVLSANYAFDMSAPFSL